MLDVILVNGVARGIVTRDLGHRQNRIALGDAAGVSDRRLWQRFLPFHQRYRLQTLTATFSPPTKRARPSPIRVTRRFIQTCIPVTGDHQSKLTLMSDIAAQRWPNLRCLRNSGDKRAPSQIPENERDYYLERKVTPVTATWRRAIFLPAPPRRLAIMAWASVKRGRGVYLDFDVLIGQQGVDTIRQKYGNLFDNVPASPEKTLSGAECASYPAIPLHDGRNMGRL